MKNTTAVHEINLRKFCLERFSMQFVTSCHNPQDNTESEDQHHRPALPLFPALQIPPRDPRAGLLCHLHSTFGQDGGLMRQPLGVRISTLLSAMQNSSSYSFLPNVPLSTTDGALPRTAGTVRFGTIVCVLTVRTFGMSRPSSHLPLKDGIWFLFTSYEGPAFC